MSLLYYELNCYLHTTKLYIDEVCGERIWSNLEEKNFHLPCQLDNIAVQIIRIGKIAFEMIFAKNMCVRVVGKHADMVST